MPTIETTIAIPVYLAIVISFPQAILVLQMGFRLLNIIPPWKRVVVTAVIIAVCSYFMRGLETAFVINSLILLFIMTLSIYLFNDYSIKTCFSAVLIGFIIYSITELLIFIFWLWCTGSSFVEVIIGPLANISIFYIAAAICFVGLILAHQKNIFLYDIRRDEGHMNGKKN